ncbi:Lanthionine biosynthesis cyclase LanC [Actinokineospora spheciospongiae]|uniref:Lanthionine biosynthesis cyclase LanC n=2 Tax=Actinokineospora spheciospongiae TaxID=909613 RepID=W7IVX3_9PSEU|nr:Lanthionine biosynthesis cyclase LanC [Actinokineospora spheciospongiae]
MNRYPLNAMAASTELAARLNDPRLVRFVKNSTTGGRPRPQSLGGGAAGVALLHIERARGGAGPWVTAHTWLAAATDDELSAGANAGLFFGAPTLAFLTHAAADQPGKLARALATLDTATSNLTRTRLATAHTRIDRGGRPALAEFDLIRGLTGLGAYHLRHDPAGELTKAVLSYLVRLTQPLPDANDGLPGWWTDLAPNGARSPDFPDGHGNLGMSHGIAASLALLSLAMLRGIVVDDHAAAIGRICTWMDTWQQDTPSGPWWPGFITWEQANAGRVPFSSRQRPSWCYGTPGIARAQQLAALATGDTDRQHIAEAAMLGCLRDLAQLDRLTDSGLCHGLAGVLQATWRMAAASPEPDLAAELPNLVDRLLTRSPQDPEFLDGHAGIALALRTVGADTAPLSHWDTCLLLG